MTLTSYNNKQLCSLAFDCQKPLDYPILTWNVTFPDKPKPPPQPPQPPKVKLPICIVSFSNKFYNITFTI